MILIRSFRKTMFFITICTLPPTFHFVSSSLLFCALVLFHEIFLCELFRPTYLHPTSFYCTHATTPAILTLCRYFTDPTVVALIGYGLNPYETRYISPLELMVIQLRGLPRWGQRTNPFVVEQCPPFGYVVLNLPLLVTFTQVETSF